MIDTKEAHREDTLTWDGARFGQTFESARLYVHIAKEASIAAILRRGPGRQTALLKWELDTDNITLGQWVHSRIYERRCDISPDGKYFLYFAAKHKGPLYSWTAISILPWFRACVLWNKGDCWGGGGLFHKNHSILLNHRPSPFNSGISEFSIHKGHLPRPWKSFTQFGEHSGWGEDEPINTERLSRYGWSIQDRIRNCNYTEKGRYKWQTEGANVIEKSGPLTYRLRLIDDEHAEVNGRSYLTECQILAVDGSLLRTFGRVDWADWHNDYLLFARNGCLWRLKNLKTGTPNCIMDLNSMKFENIIAPYEGAQDDKQY